MAELRNDSGALRFAVELVGQVPVRPLLALEATDAANGQLLASAGLEYLDRRDGEGGPLGRLPAPRFSLGAPGRGGRAAPLPPPRLKGLSLPLLGGAPPRACGGPPGMPAVLEPVDPA